MTPSVLCLHCGAAVAASSASVFCCRGCAAVYEILREKGLDAYYTLRKKMGADHDLTPVRLSNEGFAYLDDPEFVSAYAFAEGREMRFYLEGVHCAACVWLTEKLPELDPGVEALRLDLSSGVAWVRIKPEGSFASAAQGLARIGYQPHPVRQDESDALYRQEDRRHLIRIGVAAMASGNIMLLAVALYAGADGTFAQVFRWVSFALSLPVLFFSAVPFYRGAWAALRTGQVSIDVPIVFGLLVGSIASAYNLVRGFEHIYFDSITTLVFLMLSTRYLLRKANRRALDSSQILHFLAPSMAHRKGADGNFEEVKTNSLREGDVIRVLPGECLAADGTVIQGESTVDCALLTGESLPQLVSPGMPVHAGTWNRQAPLEIRVSRAGAGTRLGSILSSMEEGLARKAPIVTYLDRVGQAFIGAVLALTVLGFFLGLMTSWDEAIRRALAVAIVVCPCTFALATPLAMSMAMSRAAKKGILVKGADVIERLSRIKVAFFDKTGTLTHGELEVAHWEPLTDEATQLLIALEARSAHPIARAVQKHFEDDARRASALVLDGFEEKPGHGVSAWFNGSKHEARALQDSAVTSIGLYRGRELIGRLRLSDRVRTDSYPAVDRLRKLGISVFLLSGDSKGPVDSVARSLGIGPDHVYSRVYPEEKARIVSLTPHSLMVGDGANDAISLASAFASVAVQGGMEASLRASGAYSSRPGVMPVVDLVVLARQTMSVIRRNLVFAIFYNVLGVSVALSGHLDPLFAAVLMPASALTVFVSTIVGGRR